MKCVTNLAAFDSSFIGLALDTFFGIEVLKKSSAGGKVSNFNQTSHEALDPEVLTFLKGMHDILIFLFIQRK